MQTLGETADGEIPEALGQKDGLDAVEQLEVTWPVGAARQEIFGCRPQAWNYGFRHGAVLYRPVWYRTTDVRPIFG